MKLAQLGSLSALALALLAACSDSDRGGQYCVAGEVKCTEKGVLVCRLDGGGFVPGACADNQACVTRTCDDPALCPDVCKDIICEPGERLCGIDNVFVYECDETGTDVRSCGSCAAPPINGVCFEGQCVSLCGQEQKSYLGCEYFGVDLDNANVPCDQDANGNLIFCDAAAGQYAVVVSNPDTRFSAFVSITNGPASGSPPGQTCAPTEPDPAIIAAAVIPPKGIQIFELPRRDVNGTTQARLAYRIASNIPITAYQFNPLENVDVFSNDASVLFPTNAMGTDYYVMTREQTFNELKTFLTVVGVNDRPTKVTVTVTGKTLAGPNIPALDPGEELTVTLEKYELLNLETNRIGDDLTGSRVRADRPVVVFGGSEAANAPNDSRCDLDTGKCAYDQTTPCACSDADGPACNPHVRCQSFVTCCADHLEMQMIPVSAWGDEYVAVRSYPRGLERDVWRLLAGTDGTEVTIVGETVTVPILNAGEWFEFESGEDFVVYATHPLMLGQFLAAQDAPNPGKQDGDAGIGDPAFMLLAPERQWRDSYVFLAPNKYAQDFVSIAYRAGTDVRLDSQLLDTISNATIEDVSGSVYRAARVPIGDGFHLLSCDEPCSVMVHGYDNYVSYGYPGGLNLEDEAE